jgi:ankyrin repeat protein
MKSIHIKLLMAVGLLLQGGMGFADFAEKGQNILDAISRFNNISDSKLIEAAEEGNLKDLEVALNDPKVDLDEIGEKSFKTALMHASRNGHKVMVELLLNKGASPHILSGWGSSSALREAVKGNHKEIVKLLLMPRGKCVDANSRLSLGYALIEAILQGHKDTAKLLLDNKADPNVEGGLDSDSSSESTSALIEAARKGDKDMVKLLLDKGANINFQDCIRSVSALMQATIQGHKDLVELLLDNGADPHLKNVYDATALDYAKREGDPAIIQLFS